MKDPDKYGNTLHLLGPDGFIRYAQSQAKSVPKREYYPIRTPSPSRHMTIHPEDFIRLIYKLTSAFSSPVSLDVRIEPSGVAGKHVLVAWGVRDPGLRKDGKPIFLASYQKGIWTLPLEDMLRYGVSHEQVETFRKHLCLRPEDEYDDATFFHIRPPEIQI